jgi:hypothetical protein
MILYHFTSARHLRPISRYGLAVGDVPTDLDRWRGRIGVWLTSSSVPYGHGLEGSTVEKGAYRLSVSVADDSPLLHRWADWAPKNVTPDTIKRLHKVASKSETWFVFFGVIRPEAIIECVHMATGAAVADWASISPPSLDVKAIPPSGRKAWQRRMLKMARASSGVCRVRN